MVRACVFAPVPILTVTVEEVDGRPDLHLHAGGQGVWIGRLVAELGVDVVVCGAFGGETGQVIRCLLAGEDFAVSETAVASANGAYVHDRRSGTRREVAAMAPGTLSRHDADELYGATFTAALEGDVCVLGGPGTDDIVPAEMYRRLASDLVANGATVVADLSGALLDAVVEGGASVVKVSHEELLREGRAVNGSPPALLDAVAAIADRTGGTVACTRAGESTLAVADGNALEVSSPPLEPVESRGAGDSFTAGLAAGLARGLALEDVLRLGAVAGAPNVTRRGLGTGRRAQVEALVDRVTVGVPEWR